MKGNFDKVIYIIIFAVTIILNFMTYDVISSSKSYYKDCKEDYANSVIEYIENALENEEKNANQILEYFNNTCNYSDDEIYNDIKLIKTKIIDYNISLLNYTDIYVVLKNGEYLRMKGNNSEYFEKHSIENDETLKKIYETCSFNVMQYDEFDGEYVYIYEGPLIDKNKNPYGILLRTMNFDALTSKILSLDKSYYDITVVVTDKNNSPIMYINSNGIQTKENDDEIEVNTTKYIDKASSNMYDKERELNFYVYVEDTESYKMYLAVTFIITIIFLIIYLHVVMRYMLRKLNIKKDALIVGIIVWIASIAYAIEFDVFYREELNNLYFYETQLVSDNFEDKHQLELTIIKNIQTEITEIKNKCDSNISENEFYNTVENNLNINEYDHLIKYINSNQIYLVGENNAYDLYYKNIIEKTTLLNDLYDEYIDSNNSSNEIYHTTGYASASKLIKIYKIDKYLFVTIYNTEIYQRDLYQKIDDIDKTDGIYLIETGEDKLKILKIRDTKNDSSNIFENKNFIVIENDNFKDDIKNFLNNDEKYDTLSINNYQYVIKPVFVTKLTNNDIVTMFYYDTDEIYNIRKKTVINMFDFTVVALFLWLYVFLHNKYMNSKVETIQLHGNY